MNPHPSPTTRWKGRGDKPYGRLPSGRPATPLPLCHDWTRVVALSPLFPPINTNRERDEQNGGVKKRGKTEKCWERERLGEKVEGTKKQWRVEKQKGFRERRETRKERRTGEREQNIKEKKERKSRGFWELKNIEEDERI